MPTQINLTTELSRERLLELRDEIDALLGFSPAGPPASTTEVPVPGAIDSVAIALRDRLSPNLKSLVKYIVEQQADREFYWEDVAAGLGRDVGTVKSWHRSLSKPMNRLARENPTAPHLLADRWDGTRQVYTLDRGWKAAIERTWGDGAPD
jgi:hypothetical protein